MRSAALRVCDDYEIIIVNDASPDDSLKKVLSLLQIDSRLKVIDLSRNYGHHKAMMIGLEHANGDNVFLIDSDLDEPPELLIEFWDSIGLGEYDLVVGKQNVRRKLSFMSSFLHNGFYWIYNRLNQIHLDPNEMVARLMKRNYIDAIIEYQEYNLFLPAIWNDLGFHKKSILSRKNHGTVSTYSLKKKVLLSLDAIVSSSAGPIYFLFFIGVLISSVSLISIIAIVIKWSLYDIELGWTSLIVSIWSGIGIIMLSLGIVGIYIAKIYNEVKGRPRVNIRKIYQKGSKNDV